MTIPIGLKVTKLMNGLDYTALSTGEAQLLEEEMDRMNTAYRGIGYAIDPANTRDKIPIIVLSHPIKKEDWSLYSGVDITSQWKSQLEGRRIKKIYLEIEFKGKEKRTLQFAFGMNQDVAEWLSSIITSNGHIGIADKLEMTLPIRDDSCRWDTVRPAKNHNHKRESYSMTMTSSELLGLLIGGGFAIALIIIILFIESRLFISRYRETSFIKKWGAKLEASGLIHHICKKCGNHIWSREPAELCLECSKGESA